MDREPLSPYACSKAGFELYLRAYGQVSACGTRFFAMAMSTGRDRIATGRPASCRYSCRGSCRGEPIQVNARAKKGDGGCVRDYVYVRDSVRANLAAFEGALDGRTINIATGQATSTQTLAQMLVELVDRPAIVNDGPYRAGDSSVPSSTRR